MQNIKMQYKLYEGLHKPERTEIAALMNELCQKDTKEEDNDLVNRQTKTKTKQNKAKKPWITKEKGIVKNKDQIIVENGYLLHRRYQQLNLIPIFYFLREVVICAIQIEVGDRQKSGVKKKDDGLIIFLLLSIT